MFYFMLTNTFPFDTPDHTEVYQFNKSMLVDFSHPRLLKTSKEALELLTAMLRPNLEDRITCDQALQHPFFFNEPKLSMENNSSELLENHAPPQP